MKTVKAWAIMKPTRFCMRSQIFSTVLTFNQKRDAEVYLQDYYSSGFIKLCTVVRIEIREVKPKRRKK